MNAVCHSRSFLRTGALAVVAALVGIAPNTGAQGGGGMGRGAMGMRHDPTMMSRMSLIHDLVVNHDRIARTVTNLPDGVRTVTESDDPRIAAVLREHVRTSMEAVADAKDPALPMESAALRTIFRNAALIRTTTDTSAKGVTVVQRSSDSATVAALQQHAAEVSELVKGGMEALHKAMMGAGGNGFAAMQARGAAAMGVDQYTSTHKFDALADGGRIELQRDVDDSAGVTEIRRHLQEIAAAFKSGDFSTPAFVHLQKVPGAETMAAKRALIAYEYRDLPRGGELRLVSKDAEAVAAIHRFMEFQRTEHRAGGTRPPDEQAEQARQGHE